jgi:molybdate transport system regulatory protein
VARITLRIDIDDKGSIGPGKVRLLELIAAHGSIRQAGVALKMSYGRAWGLVQELNTTFGRPVVRATPGGASGGGARLTPLGEDVVASYRAAESASARAARASIAKMQALARKS